MKLKLPCLTLLTLALLACRTGDLFMMKRDEALNLYASAIRWGSLETAADFQNPAHRTRIDEAWMKNIHVSSYDTIYMKSDSGSNILEQTVKIHYYIEPEGVDKSITDRQVWRYDNDQGKWILDTALPAFR